MVSRACLQGSVEWVCACREGGDRVSVVSPTPEPALYVLGGLCPATTADEATTADVQLLEEWKSC